MSKSDQMLSILWLLRSGRKLTAGELADKLEIHIRTVYRCIDSLCASGAPIIADSGPGGGYRILGRFAESPLLFDQEEQKALVHASTFAREAGYPHSESLERAIDKLKLYTNDEQLLRLELHDQGVSVIYPPLEERERSFLQQLEEAAAQGMTLEMVYDKGRSEPPVSRDFDPYGIVHWKGCWYTVGYCRLRQTIRSFRADRIVKLGPTEQRFDRPGGFSAKAHLLESLLPGSLDGETMVNVRIAGPEQALNELGRHWLFGHALISREPEEALFRIGQAALVSYVPYFLLPYGKALTILEPLSLVERLVRVSAEVAAHYAEMKGQFGKRLR
ncbi:YafY family transcriptional regulator [Paenibacillus sp. Marseille-P2973]|uniref:helix-turn-helix transcriptional regulator n=1 Tax=Paenibacillus sp. Marseille-P2973 TaxID=1871032 RepID=UPI001B373D16|nr:YafY family protein [Paenibacillus sp. Marseille-P2973]MBQ4898587.1 YafY family transcriptional regulator [Paenibacillus sp. Marseille-P2973]